MSSYFARFVFVLSLFLYSLISFGRSDDLKGKCITVYGFNGCGYFDKAIPLAQQLCSSPYSQCQVRVVNKDQSEWYDTINKLHGSVAGVNPEDKTSPFITISDYNCNGPQRYFGGYQQLAQFYQNCIRS